MHPIKLQIIANNENAALCGPCGGRCCKSVPGYTFPSDFGQTVEEMERQIIAALRTGKFCVDDDDEEGSNFIRPALIHEEGMIWGHMTKYGGACSLLTSSGCSLSFDKRPTMCRALKPGICAQQGINNQDAIDAWRPYQDVISRAAEMVESCT